jgi:hypothetical protein
MSWTAIATLNASVVMPSAVAVGDTAQILAFRHATPIISRTPVSQGKP